VKNNPTYFYLLKKMKWIPKRAFDIKRTKTNLFVLSCFDPRFTGRLADHLINEKKLHYDYVSLAGSSFGVMQTKYPTWRTTFYQHLDIAIKNHDIKEVWAFDHLDCAMYKNTLNLKDDTDPSIHLPYIKGLQYDIGIVYPQLRFQGFMMMLDGSIKRVL